VRRIIGFDRTKQAKKVVVGAGSRLWIDVFAFGTTMLSLHISLSKQPDP